MPETWFEWSARERATEAPFMLEVHGLEEIQEALEKMGSEWKDYADKALGKGMAVLVTDAKKEAPVDEGILKSSIGSQIIRGAGSEIIGKMGSALVYASYQEYGTRYQSGKPYLRPALEKNRDKIVKLFKEGIDEALRKLGLKP